MPMPRRQQFRGAAATTRRTRQWSVVDQSISIVTGGAVAGLINLTTELEVALGFNAHNWTASALRLNMSVDRVATGGASDTARLIWGVGWFNNDAVAAGAASLPNPAIDNADWYAHGSYVWHASGTGARNGDDANTQVPVHSDSMRKQRENNSSLMFIARATFSDVQVQINLAGRVLYLLG